MIRQFEVIPSERSTHIVTNGEFSVSLLGISEAYMVCNMINGLVSVMNLHTEGLVEENEQLKQENEELRAFQHNVFKNMEKTMKGGNDD